MADIRIKDLATTATTTASDDFMAVDGVTNGTRKLSAAAPAFLTSVTTPSLTSPASTNLTLAGGAGNSSIILTPAGTGNVGIGTTTPGAVLPSGWASSANAKVLEVRSAGEFDSGVFIRASTERGLDIWTDGDLANSYIDSRYNSSNPSYGSIFFRTNTLGTPFSAMTIKYNGDTTLGSTTAGSSGAGALVVAGGISAGNTGSAASYFGGAVTVATTLADQGGTIAAQRNGLAPRQGLAFDGTGSTTVTLPALGTNGLSASFLVTPTAIGSTQAILQGGVNSLGVVITSGGNILATVPGVDDRLTSTGTLTNGKTAHVAVTRTSAGVWVIYINGIASGTATTAVDDITATSYRIGSTTVPANYFIGAVSGGFIYNRALSAAEVLALYQSGAVASADYPSQVAGTALITGNNSTFAGAGNWAASFGTGSASVSAGTLVITGGNTQYGAAGYFGTYITAGNSLGGFKTYAKYRVKLDINALSGGNLLISEGTGGSPLGSFTATGANQSIEFVVPAYATTADIALMFSATGCSATIDNITITPLGALLAPDANNAGAGLEWLDVSGNRAHIILPTSGVSWSLPSSQQIVIEASTATNGNQQLGGASLIDANKQWRIQSWTVNCSTGTPTISLGNVSAGTQYNAAAVLAAGNNDITLVTRFPSTANLWVNSSTTATLIHRITLVPAN